MEKALNSKSIKSRLFSIGWNQKQLAEEIGVTSQAVTNWLKGDDFPRPAALLKLGNILDLGFDELVMSKAQEPVIAFRKKGSSITTDKHIKNASSMGALLKSLVPFLPQSNTLRSTIQNPSVDYSFLQNAAAEVRKKIGIGSTAVLKYEHLINEFHENGAVIIPVMWGSRQHHGNALHILLPDENVTFIYLNLDTHEEDFKFWMAHELAHVYTPELAGSLEGEDFADAFAGALLFPRELAHEAYSKAVNKKSIADQINVFISFAVDHEISLYSIYCEVRNYAEAHNLPQLNISSTDIHQIRNIAKGVLISEAIFSPGEPDAKRYMALACSIFKSSFFDSLKRMFKEYGTGAGYIQQLLDVSIKDSLAIHSELLN